MSVELDTKIPKLNRVPTQFLLWIDLQVMPKLAAVITHLGLSTNLSNRASSSTYVTRMAIPEFTRRNTKSDSLTCSFLKPTNKAI